MQKLNIGLIAAVVIFVALNIFQFIFWRNMNTEVAEQYTQEIANLEQTIAGYGSEATVYTVSTAVKSGDEITDDNIETMKMYSSLMTEQYVTNPEDIIGRYFKIAVNPGTPIMFNMAMDEEMEDSTRDRDIVLDRLTVGLEVGDYIDVRITMPYGDDYIVLSHKRVYGIGEGSIKLHLTEYEWNVYQGALVDYFLNSEYGCSIYGDRYVEPGLQQEAVPFYAVPANIAALLQKNPNILDKQEAASLNEWRNALEELLVIFRDNEDTVDADGGRLAAGRTTMDGLVETDRNTLADEKEEEQQMAEQQAEENAGEEVDEDFWDEDPTATDDSGTEPTEGDEEAAAGDETTAGMEEQ